MELKGLQDIEVCQGLFREKVSNRIQQLMLEDRSEYNDGLVDGLIIALQILNGVYKEVQ